MHNKDHESDSTTGIVRDRLGYALPPSFSSRTTSLIGSTSPDDAVITSLHTVCGLEMLNKFHLRIWTLDQE